MTHPTLSLFSSPTHTPSAHCVSLHIHRAHTHTNTHTHTHTHTHTLHRNNVWSDSSRSPSAISHSLVNTSLATFTSRSATPCLRRTTRHVTLGCSPQWYGRRPGTKQTTAMFCFRNSLQTSKFIVISLKQEEFAPLRLHSQTFFSMAP